MLSLSLLLYTIYSKGKRNHKYKVAFCFSLQAVHFFNAFGITWRHPSLFFSTEVKGGHGEKKGGFIRIFFLYYSIWFILLVKIWHKNNHSVLLWLLLCIHWGKKSGEGNITQELDLQEKEINIRKSQDHLWKSLLSYSIRYKLPSSTISVYLSSMSRKKSWWTTFLQEMYQGNPGLDYLINQWS